MFNLKHISTILWGCSCVFATAEARWTPVVDLPNGDVIYWSDDYKKDENHRYWVEELRDLKNPKDTIRSYVTEYEVDCEKERIRAHTYAYYADYQAQSFLEKESPPENRKLWAYAVWNEYVKHMVSNYCFEE